MSIKCRQQIDKMLTMIYELQINPKLLALATVGATLLGMKLDDALLRPIVKPADKTATGKEEV